VEVFKNLLKQLNKVCSLVLNFIQIVGKVGTIYYVTWPGEYDGFLRVLSPFSLDLIGSMPVKCITPYNYHHQLRTMLVVPLIVNGSGVLSRLCLLKAGKIAQANQAMRPWLLFNYLAYISICTTCFRTIPCQEMPDGSTWLRADYSIDCTSGEHRLHFVLAIIGILVYTLGIPAGIFVLLWRNRKLIGPGRTEDSMKQVAHLNMFVEHYRPNVWWSECIVCAQKCSMAGVLVFVPQSTLQMALGLLVSIGWFGYYSFVTPYRNPILNYLVILMNACLCCIMLCAVLLGVDGDGYDHHALSVILLLVTITPILVSALYVFRAPYDIFKATTSAAATATNSPGAAADPDPDAASSGLAAAAPTKAMQGEQDDGYLEVAASHVEATEEDIEDECEEAYELCRV